MKKLFLITKTFPLGAEEKTFLQREAELLQKKFDLTYVTTEKYVLDKNPIETKSKIVQIDGVATVFEKMGSAVSFLCKKDAWIEFADIVKSGKFVPQRLFRALMFGTAAETFWRHFKNASGLQKKDDVILYFYWWDYKCFGATSHKKQYPNMRIVSRTHGYDLYEERELYGKQFFKKQMESKLDRLYFISEFGKKYYEEHYGEDKEKKRFLYRLGVKRQVQEEDLEHGKDLEPVKDFMGQDEPLLMVSCSNVIPLKRIHLIIEGLANLTDTKVKWVHFGDGSLLEEMKTLAESKLAEKSNISYEFVGRVDNQKVMDYYVNQPVGCFITTTSTEGNPVSVQEALSFGIPVIGTTVSDIPCMIEGNGVLLPENPTADEVAEGIKRVALATKEELAEMRVKSYQIWEKDYDGAANYQKFVDNLLEV